MKLFSTLLFAALFNICYAADDEAKSSENEAPEAIVIVCPEHTANKGDEVPKFATTVDAINFFCNDQQETETDIELTAETDSETESEAE
jgi:hypothetical protein